MRLFPALAAISLLALSFLTHQPAHASAVVGTGSAASCTYAALVAAINTGGSITFNCGSAPHTITITGATPLVASATTIDGGGKITLSGGGTRKVLEIKEEVTLTIQNLTIANGYSTETGGGINGRWKANLNVINCRFENNFVQVPSYNNDHGGGGLYTHTGVLNVSDSEFVGNRAANGSGAAIHTLFTNVTITDTVFENNESTGYGAAFYNDGHKPGGGGFVRFTRVRFLNNSGRGQGGAVFNFMYPSQAGSLTTFDTVEFTNNRVTPDSYGNAFGGALRVGNGPARILNATFAGNRAEQQGGALWTGEVSSLNILNTTFSGNRAQEGSQNQGLGGAITIASSGAFNLDNVTLVDNYAGFMGGAIWGGGGSVRLRNTIVANNTASNPWGLDTQCGSNNPGSPAYRGSSNLQSPKSSSDDRTCAGGTSFANPLLGGLANNGGFSPTRALLSGSPAIDAGNGSVCPDEDQRGQARIDGDGSGGVQCDLGAYEFVPNQAPFAPGLTSPANAAAIEGSAVTLNWNAAAFAAQYRVQVAATPNFASLIYNVTLGNVTSYRLPYLRPGTYSWRVLAVNSTGSTPSETRSFTLNSAGSAAPLLTAFTTTTQSLTWSPLTWADGYAVEVSATANFASLLVDQPNLSKNATSTSVSLGSGVYYWRVRARDANGAWGVWSDAIAFVVALP